MMPPVQPGPVEHEKQPPPPREPEPTSVRRERQQTPLNATSKNPSIFHIHEFNPSLTTMTRTKLYSHEDRIYEDTNT